MGPPRRPLLQQASESVQVGCEDRDTHGAFEAFLAMRAHPVQAMTFQRMDRRFHARMPAARHERCFTFPSSAGLRASPLRGQRDVLQHRGQLLLVDGGAVEPPVETASAQLRILCLACRHQRNPHVHIAALPLQVPTQDELMLIFQHRQGNPKLHRPALPFMIQRVCGSNSENSFSSCGIVSPSSTRRRI